ncbi:MAG: MBOAT family protein [Hyphomonas sp.]
MLFTDPIFLFKFLPLVLLGFCVTSLAGTRAHRLAFLVAVSLVFYSWFKAEYLILLVGSLIFNFVLATKILKAPQSKKSKLLLVFGIAANLSLLGVYKYLGFFVLNLNEIFEVGLPDPALLLPLAISFFTFQQISYLCDSHAGKIERKDHTCLEYTIFVTFFPQLIAGPIVHHSEMMPQFKTAIPMPQRSKMFAEGLLLFSAGLFKKLVIADALAPHADLVFAAADDGQILDFWTAWSGALAYTFQIYFDFSGYSDMAIGLGLLFGIRLPWNFNSPYKSTNISEFWRRWHMTLSRWLRDYLYIPLGGNRKGTARQYANNFTTMVLGGLWHGAHWNFVIWGALHGVFLIINQLFRFLAGRVGLLDFAERASGFRLFAWAVTLLATIIAWVFFRAGTTHGAFNMVYSMFMMAEGISIDVPSTTLAVLCGAALVSFLLPNTKQISAAFNTMKFKISLLHPVVFGCFSGAAAGFAYLAALRVTQSPFLYFNF